MKIGSALANLTYREIAKNHRYDVWKPHDLEKFASLFREIPFKKKIKKLNLLKLNSIIHCILIISSLKISKPYTNKYYQTI